MGLKRTTMAIAITLGVVMLIWVGLVSLESALLQRDAGITLEWLAAGAGQEPPPNLLVSSVPALEPQQVDEGSSALAGDWRIRGIVQDSLHDAVWVIVQVSPNLGSMAGTVSSIRYRRLGLFRFALLPDSSDLVTHSPDTDHQ
jgi:hypothetical protein